MQFHNQFKLNHVCAATEKARLAWLPLQLTHASHPSASKSAYVAHNELSRGSLFLAGLIFGPAQTQFSISSLRFLPQTWTILNKESEELILKYSLIFSQFCVCWHKTSSTKLGSWVVTEVEIEDTTRKDLHREQQYQATLKSNFYFPWNVKLKSGRLQFEEIFSRY